MCPRARWRRWPTIRRPTSFRATTWSRPRWRVTNQSIGADLVHEGGWAPGIGPLTGKGIGIAVIDSGVAMCRNSAAASSRAVDFTDDRGPGLDQNGHGTHVAGIIAAAGANRFDETRGRGAGREHHQPEGAGREGPGRRGRRHRGDRLGGREPQAATTSASSTCRSAAR